MALGRSFEQPLKYKKFPLKRAASIKARPKSREVTRKIRSISKYRIAAFSGSEHAAMQHLTILIPKYKSNNRIF